MFAADQPEVLENANITNLGKQKLDYTLRHRYPWEEEPHLVRELGQTREDGSRAESVIAGDVWSIILRPQGTNINWQLLFLCYGGRPFTDHHYFLPSS